MLRTSLRGRLVVEVVGDGGEFCGASHPLAQLRLAQEFRFITDRVLVVQLCPTQGAESDRLTGWSSSCRWRPLGTSPGWRSCAAEATVVIASS